MSRFPSYLRRALAGRDEANIQRATRDAIDKTDHTKYAVPVGGDNQRLRGIPAIGPGVTGAIPGTRPEDATR